MYKRQGTVFADIDVNRLISERRRMTTYPAQNPEEYVTVEFSLKTEETKLQILSHSQNVWILPIGYRSH